MTSFARKTDPRRRQYARFAQTVLETLRESVDRRTSEGLSKKDIADRIQLAPSSLSRILNGRVSNLTIKTISDILWAAEHEPREFGADALEDLSPNHVPAHLTAMTVTTFQTAAKSSQETTVAPAPGISIRQLESVG